MVAKTKLCESFATVSIRLLDGTYRPSLRSRCKHAVASRLPLAKWFLSWDWRPRLSHDVASRLKIGRRVLLGKHKLFTPG